MGRDVVPRDTETRRRMERQGRRDTQPERRLRSELHRRGLRFRVDRPLLPGHRSRADIVFGPSRVAVFVDGCFWHGCPEHFTQPKNNAAWWAEKIERNRERDRRVTELLEREGWAVVRVWEHEDPRAAVDLIFGLVERRRSARAKA